MLQAGALATLTIRFERNASGTALYRRTYELSEYRFRAFLKTLVIGWRQMHNSAIASLIVIFSHDFPRER
jgi:hypothetical protein